MKQYYYLIEPIRGVQAKGGTAQTVLLPSGTALEWVRRSRRWPNVAEIEYDGAIVILFFDELCRRSEVRESQGQAMRAGR